jgi:hypothetical protein
MRHFEMRFDTPERLRAALAANPTAVDDGDGYENSPILPVSNFVWRKLLPTQLETKQVAISETVPT